MFVLADCNSILRIYLCCFLYDCTSATTSNNGSYHILVLKLFYCLFLSFIILLFQKNSCCWVPPAHFSTSILAISVSLT